MNSSSAVVIYLTGFMGSGKSTVGRELARRLERPFIDLDHLVEKARGRSIARIFADEGEAAFREAERQTLTALPLAGGPVVATGGGVLFHPDNRRFMARSGVLVWLKCPLTVILHRLGTAAGEPGRRPLWSGDRMELGRLLEERTPVYTATANLVVDAALEKGETVRAILRWLEERGE